MEKEKLLELAKPISLNTKMVRAILDGKKTVTRRVIKFPVNRFTRKVPNANNIAVIETKSDKVNFHEEPCFMLDVKFPYKRGDILYVRETYSPNYFDETLAGYRSDGLRGNRNAYKADYRKEVEGDYVPEPKWKPSIHMPKEAARIFLKVTDVRVERLQDITEDQAKKEGCYHSPLFEGDSYEITALSEFPRLWNSTLKTPDIDKFEWTTNPWVWVIEFTVLL